MCLESNLRNVLCYVVQRCVEMQVIHPVLPLPLVHIILKVNLCLYYSLSIPTVWRDAKSIKAYLCHCHTLVRNVVTCLTIKLYFRNHFAPIINFSF